MHKPTLFHVLAQGFSYDNSSRYELIPEVCCQTTLTSISFMRICEECGSAMYLHSVKVASNLLV